ncbi:outer membrane putative beta-barrel porin/alpha-amylase [Pseudomonas sp. WPR_5_2]|nr:outer membrane putative beta-barrel porin/alpha-amylase [Pseudomonas sp. WPR_5_2]
MGVSNWVNLTPSHCLSLSQRYSGTNPALASTTSNVIHIIDLYEVFHQTEKLAQALLNDITKPDIPSGLALIINKNNKGDVMKMSTGPARANPGRLSRGRLQAHLLHASLFGLMAGFSCGALAMDVDAGDYTALPKDTNLGLLYYQHAERNALYADGHKVPIHAGLDSDIGILRGVHFMQLGDYIVDPQFLLPFGNVRAKDDLKDLGSDSGIGDLILAATVWLVNEPEKRRYFGITPFLFVPTGSYDKDNAINLGENRWKFTLQSGYITGLTDKVTLDLVGDVTFFGHNNDYGNAGVTQKQEPLYQGQAFLRYNFTERFDVRAGVSKLWGGESEIAGLDMNDKPGTSKYTVGTSYFITPSTQLMANYGQDMSVDSGFKEERRINLRLLQLF